MGEEFFGLPTEEEMLAAYFLTGAVALFGLGWLSQSLEKAFLANLFVELGGFSFGAFVALLVLARHERRQRELRWDPVCQELLRGAARDIVVLSQELHRGYGFPTHWHAGLNWAEADAVSPRVADNMRVRAGQVMKLVDASDMERNGRTPDVMASLTYDVLNAQTAERLQGWVQPLLAVAEGEQMVAAVRALQGLAAWVSSGSGHLGAQRAQENPLMSARDILAETFSRMEDTYRKIIATPYAGPVKYDLPHEYPSFEGPRDEELAQWR
jgi:hypothetical protein